MKKTITTILVVCGMYSAMAQAPEIEWQVTLGGSDWDVARAVKQTNDGGYIVAGSSSSTDGDVTGNHGDTDFWIVKLRNGGNIQWQKSLGGSKEDKANSIQQTTDGGYIIAGSTKSNNGDVTGWHEGYENGDQNYPYSDYWIVKLNNAGVIQWQKALGGSEREEAHSIKQTNDGGFIVIGWTRSTDGDIVGNSGGLPKQWVVKLDTNGNVQWQKILEDWNSIKSDIQQTSDNGYIIAYQNKIIKLDNVGNTQWEVSNGADYSYYGFNSIRQTLDGGYIAVGDVIDFVYSILKIDNLGNTEWSMTVEEGGEFEITAATSVQQTSDGGYIVTGGIYQDTGMDSYNIWTVKLNNSGEIQWKKVIGNPTDDWQVNSSYSVRQTLDGGYILGGSNAQSYSNGSTYDYLIIKLASDHTLIPDNAFEQRLIDLGLDDVLDGYVLTSNISDVTQLDVSNRNISDLTGIEDFASLLSLNCSNNQLTSLVFGDGAGGKNANATNDFGLEYLNASGNQLTELDVSGLSSLTTLLVNNNALTKLNVQNGNNTNITAFNATNNPDLFCIQVDDAAWSTTNWTNIDGQTSFNEDCAYMSVTDSQLSQLEIYPNPAKDVVYFSKAIDGELFDATGKKVMSIKNAKSINVVGLAKGVYLLKTSEGITKKIVVK